MGLFRNRGITALRSAIGRDPERVQALVTAFEEACRKTCADPAYAEEVARRKFPGLPPAAADAATDAELGHEGAAAGRPAPSRRTDPDCNGDAS